jgi:hypothetical protein
VITDSDIVISQSAMLISDSDRRQKVITFRAESMITFDQNGRSPWFRIGDQLRPEYARPTISALMDIHFLCQLRSESQ